MINMAGRVVGIDAGGSATRAALVVNGQVTALPDAAPMNALLTSGVPDRLAAIIAGARATAAGVGMPGVRSRSQAQQLSAELTARARCPVRVTDDAHTAWLGAFGGAPGIIVLAGTGSIAVGSDGTRWARAGGHGFILGDEGGAYWIGRAAARAALRWHDGRGGSELLAKKVREAAGIGLDALVACVNSHPAERARLARLAPAITELAAEDDAARRIVRRAVRRLAGLAAAVQATLGPLPVAASGGVFRSAAVWDDFAARTGAVRPAAPAVIGAALFGGDPERFGERGYA